jgi:transcriptional regulator with XRE-family HTH domain
MDRDFQELCRALGRRVRELRLERQMTQEDMMDHGFSVRHYQRIEAGWPATFATIWKLARAFQVTPRMVLPDEVAEPKAPKSRRQEGGGRRAGKKGGRP